MGPPLLFVGRALECQDLSLEVERGGVVRSIGEGAVEGTQRIRKITLIC